MRVVEVRLSVSRQPDAQTRSLVAVGAADSYWGFEASEAHSVSVAHWRLLVAVGAAVWYWLPLQDVTVAHWRLLVAVGAAVSY